jgi:phosphoglycolate phosphatase-like HAD superfamily hydrolase
VKTICFDFDGVIHSYVSGWKGADVIPDPPVEGISEVIQELREQGYQVVINSARCGQENGVAAILKYLDENNIRVDKVCLHKPPALMYVDDRAIHFNGNPKDLLKAIKGFKCWLDKGLRYD